MSYSGLFLPFRFVCTSSSTILSAVFDPITKVGRTRYWIIEKSLVPLISHIALERILGRMVREKNLVSSIRLNSLYEIVLILGLVKIRRVHGKN